MTVTLVALKRRSTWLLCAWLLLVLLCAPRADAFSWGNKDKSDKPKDAAVASTTGSAGEDAATSADDGSDNKSGKKNLRTAIRDAVEDVKNVLEVATNYDWDRDGTKGAVRESDPDADAKPATVKPNEISGEINVRQVQKDQNGGSIFQKNKPRTV